VKEHALDRFKAMPADARTALKEAAKAHGVDYLDLIRDHAHMEALQEARRMAILEIHQHHQVSTIAGWFGVSRVAINNLVRPDRLIKGKPPRAKLNVVAFDGQGIVVPPVLRGRDRKPKEAK
jgi:hypothetical protein